MKNIGILISSTRCDKYLFETVETLSQSPNVNLFFLLSKSEQTGSRWDRMKQRGLYRTIELVAFRLMVTVEKKLLGRSSALIQGLDQECEIAGYSKNPIVALSPHFSPSGMVVRYGEEDLAMLEKLDLDLILRGNAHGIFKGNILNVAKDGILSFHHGDNRWNRGGPPGFWEVFHKRNSTGFVIQVLSEELDGGKVLFRGNIRSKASFSENLANLLEVSNPYLTEMVLDYAADKGLPVPEQSAPFGEGLLLPPSLSQTVRYFFLTFWSIFYKKLMRRLFRHEERWGIAFLKGSWQDAILRRGIRVENPPGHFLADPFVVTREGRTICFAEDYLHDEARGLITAIELFEDNSYKILGTVLDEPFHLSFPFLFEFEGEIYMIPETYQAKAIRLYKCIEFPMRWEYQKDLMSDINAVDTMVFPHEDRWWMLTNAAAKIDPESDVGSEHCSRLRAFYSDNPLSENWQTHHQKTLVFDSDIGRNGGLLFDSDNRPVRVRQKQGFHLYGLGYSLATIHELTPEAFNEETIVEISPHFFPDISGCHHMHSNQNYTVYDYVKWECPF